MPSISFPLHYTGVIVSCRACLCYSDSFRARGSSGARYVQDHITVQFRESNNIHHQHTTISYKPIQGQHCVPDLQWCGAAAGSSPRNLPSEQQHIVILQTNYLHLLRHISRPACHAQGPGTESFVRDIATGRAFWNTSELDLRQRAFQGSL